MSRILLDENLDWRLRTFLPGHEVESVPLIGWAGFKNGELLALAELQFDVFITMDSNLSHQLKIEDHNLAVIVLKAASNRLTDTRPLMKTVLSLLDGIEPRTLITVSS